MPSSEDWSPCQKGELNSLFRGMRNASPRSPRGKQLANVAGMLLVLLVIASVTRTYMTKTNGPLAISCAEVMKNLDRYVSGEIDQQLADRIRLHLKECDHCRMAYHERSANNRRVARTGNDLRLARRVRDAAPAVVPLRDQTDLAI